VLERDRAPSRNPGTGVRVQFGLAALDCVEVHESGDEITVVVPRVLSAGGCDVDIACGLGVVDEREAAAADLLEAAVDSSYEVGGAEQDCIEAVSVDNEIPQGAAWLRAVYEWEVVSQAVAREGGQQRPALLTGEESGRHLDARAPDGLSGRGH
jgi:hypothetical protein